MSIRVVAAALLLVLAGMEVGEAQSVPAKRRAPPPGPPSVTIMTDGLAAASSGSEPSADQALAELAGALGQDQSIRLMPVMGFGAVGNIRDLLQTRGVDLAVVNADILAYLRQAGLLPSAPGRVRSIGRLLDKTVYLLASSEVGSIDELSGAAVGVIGAGSEAEVTARTVFAGLGIGIDVRPVTAAQAVPGLLARQFKAVLLLAGPDDRPLAQVPRDGAVHLLALPLNGKLGEIYEPARLSAGDEAGLVPAEGLDTLRVASVLATYNWRPGQRRYGNVVALLERLPAAVAQLRQSGAGRRWRTFDARTPIKGWQAFEPAAAMLAGLGAGPASPATSPPAGSVSLAALPETGTAPASQPTSAETGPAAPPLERLRIIGTALPGLSGAEAPRGGLLAEILDQSLAPDGGRNDSLAWADGPAALVQALGEERADLAFPLEQPACEAPDGLTPEARQACEALLFSKPLFRTIRLFFTRQGSDFTFEQDGQVAGRIICAPAAMDVQDLDADGRKWLSQELLTLLRKDSLEGCFAMLDSGEADAVYADEIEGQARLAELGLEDHILVVERPVATHSLHAAVSRKHPKAAEIMAAVDQGLASLERRGRYYELLARRLLVRTTDESAVR